MASILLDHNVARQVAIILRNSRHEVTTAQEAALARSEDAEILLVAAETQTALVTHNGADFRLLPYAWRRWTGEWQVEMQHAGIAVCPQSWSAPRIAQQIDILLRGYYSMKNELYFWQSAGSWTRLHHPRWHTD